MKKITNIIVIAIFVLYCIVLVYVTFFGAGRATVWGNVSIWDYAVRMANIHPFKTIGMYVKMLNPSHPMFAVAVINLVVNFILLYPMGFFLPVLFKKMRNFFATIGVCTLVLLVIEVMQLLTKRGSFDVDDFILNLTGAALGFVIWLIEDKLTQKRKKKKAAPRNNDSDAQLFVDKNNDYL